MRTLFLAAMLVTSAASPSSADLMDTPKTRAVQAFKDCMLKKASHQLQHTDANPGDLYDSTLSVCETVYRAMQEEVQNSVTEYIQTGMAVESARPYFVNRENDFIKRDVIRAMILERGLLRQTTAPSFLNDFNRTF